MSPRRKTVLSIIALLIVIVLAFVAYGFTTKKRPQIPDGPPPLPALPSNPPTDNGMLPPPPPALPMK